MSYVSWGKLQLTMLKFIKNVLLVALGGLVFLALIGIFLTITDDRTPEEITADRAKSDSIRVANDRAEFLQDSIQKANEENERLSAWNALTPNQRALKKIEDQFSSWDGSHKALKRATKEQLKNPDSFDHIETQYALIDTTSYRVVMKYRATNSFNAIITEAVQVDFSIEDNSVIQASKLY